MKGNIQCPDCGLDKLDPTIKEQLGFIEKALGKELFITSGCRCPVHNKEVGGVVDSPHLVKDDGWSKAVDIACESDADRYILITLLLAAGFTRLGIAKTFIHADKDLTKNAKRIWVYPI